MKAQAKRTMAGRSVRRMICAGGAVLALLLACTGCDDSIRQEVRQGAFSVLESTLSTAYTQLDSNLNTVLQDLSISGDSSGATAASTGGGG